MGVAKNLSVGMAKKKKQGRVILARSTVAKILLDFAWSAAIKQRTMLLEWKKFVLSKTFRINYDSEE